MQNQYAVISDYLDFLNIVRFSHENLYRLVSTAGFLVK